MEAWRTVWRKAASKTFSDNGLIALRKALVEDDPRLQQGATTTPTPLNCTMGWPVEGADLFAFAAWQGDGLTTVDECEEVFARACFDIDQYLEEPAGCRWFINWYDETPRGEVFRELLAEINLTLSAREEAGRGADDVIARFSPDVPKGILADALDDAQIRIAVLEADIAILSLQVAALVAVVPPPPPPVVPPFLP